MVEILYPKLDRAVIITLLNLDDYYDNTIFNNIIYELDTKNKAYIIMREDDGHVLSAVIYCDEETSKKYKNIAYKYWICVEILKRDKDVYTTKEIIHRDGIDRVDTHMSRAIDFSIEESKNIMNKIYSAVLTAKNLIYVHKAISFLRTPTLDTYGKYVAGFSEFGKIYRFYTVDNPEQVNEILEEANIYNLKRTSKACKDDKYIDVKFLTYEKHLERG